jgi:hypothetical protein
VSIPLAYVLVTRWGIVGLSITGLLGGWAPFLFAIINAKRKFGIDIPIRSALGAYAAAAIVGTPMILLNMTLPWNDLTKLVVIAPIGLIAYALLVPKTKAIDKNIIEILKEMFDAVPIIGKLVNKILAFEEKML